MEKIIKLSAPQSVIFKSTSSINLFLGGIGGGKSHLVGLISYDMITKYPNAKGFIGANTHDQLNTSTMNRVISVWKELGLVEDEHFVIGKQPPANFNTENHSFTKYHNIISFINGHIIFIGSLDNYKAHDGKEFDYAFLDETKDTKEEAVKEVIIGRLRGKEVPNTPLFVLTSPAKVKWINEWFNLDKYKEQINRNIFSETEFFSVEEKNKCIVISSTFHNRENLPSDYISKVIDNNTEERWKALIYANPFFAVGGEYFSSFSQLEHISKCTYNPELPLHISFDQNVNPYTPCLIAQIEDNDVNIINEIALEHPRNTTEHLCREILRQYQTHKAGIFIYGDATGQRRLGAMASVKSHYDIIKTVLRPLMTAHSDRVSKNNEWNSRRRDYMNAILECRLPLTLNIDPSCKLLIDDFIYLLQDVNGGKLIEKDKNGAEKLGHLSDCLEYLMTTAFNDIYKNFIKFI